AGRGAAGDRTEPDRARGGRGEPMTVGTGGGARGAALLEGCEPVTGPAPIAGRLSDLVLVRLHGRTAEDAGADDEARAAVVAACRAEATVSDLAERILQRTVYAQASSRVGPFRELLQNALDASPRGGRVEVRSSSLDAGGDREVSFSDRGRGMSRAELLE